MRPRFVRYLVSAALIFASGCGFQTYRPSPLSQEKTVAEFTARKVDAPSLREFARANGIAAAWPAASWGIDELTVLALYYHPDLDIARAKFAMASAAELTANQRLNPGLRPVLEHHSRPDDGGSPWTLGFELGFPIVIAGKREAAIERASYLAQAARLDIAASAWQVRSRMRARLVDHAAAIAELDLLRDEATARREENALLEKRLELGMLADAELAPARRDLLDIEIRLQRQSAEVERMLAKLAQALGLPLGETRRLKFAPLPQISQPPAADALREAALLNRLDIRRGLLDYAAEEAALKLEVARQYPDFDLRPGYLFDQSDRVWTLAVELLLPVRSRNEGPIAEAKARRELKARDFAALQTRVIAETEGAAALRDQIAQQLARANALYDAETTRNRKLENRFRAGAVDRLDRVRSRLQLLGARRAVETTWFELQQTAGALEDILQRPLGASLPDVTASPRAEAGGQ